MSAGITLVTGATGHLGANLVHRLLADGEQVANQIGAKVAGGPCNERNACAHGINPG